MLVTGANGPGKTNLLESLHVGTQGFSPRTRSDAQLIRDGATAARSRARRACAARCRRPCRVSLSVTSRSGPASTAPRCARRSSCGASSQRSSSRPTASSSSKVGPPRGERTSTGRSAGSSRSRASCRSSTRRRVGQRNAALAAGCGGAVAAASALAPWTAQVADLGATLTAARREVVDLLRAGLRRARGRARPRRRHARLRRRAPDDHACSRSGSTATSSGARPASGRTSTRSRSARGDRDLRTLRLAGRAAPRRAGAPARRGRADRRPPRASRRSLLLDDALSELDASRRRILSERIGVVGQTIVTATGPGGAPARAGPAARGHSGQRRRRG